MIQKARDDFAAFLRRAFLTGLLVVIPSAISLGLCWFFFRWVDHRLVELLRLLVGEPPAGAGFLLAAALVVTIGVFAQNFFGRRIVELYEAILHRVPVVNQVFPAVRQVAELVLSEKASAFQKVVLIEYPRANSYCIGFLTADAPTALAERTPHGKLLSVFVPTTPNPTSGFLLLLPEAEVQVLDMTPEEGIKLIVSGGLLHPGADLPAPGPATDVEEEERPDAELEPVLPTAT
jgi:uncharacterized membrane protein